METFGEFIRKKRKDTGLTMKTVSSEMGCSLSYLADIEKGRRNPFALEKLNQLAKILNLSKEESEKMYTLAGKAKGEIPPDLLEYIEERPGVLHALRTAKAANAKEEDWVDACKVLKREGVEIGNFKKKIGRISNVNKKKWNRIKDGIMKRKGKGEKENV